MKKCKNIVRYPAVFDPDRQNGNVKVTFPDVKAIAVVGEDVDCAAKTASTELGKVLIKQGILPHITPVSDIELIDDQYVVEISVDLDEAKRQIKNLTVRKNTTIPADLDRKARKAGINFSAVLTEALRKKLGEL